MSGRIGEFRSAIVARLKVIAPQLRSVEAQFGRFDLDELERGSIRCPGVRVTILKAPIKDHASGAMNAMLECAAFVVTEGKDREDQAWTIAEAVASELHTSQLWGLKKLGVPERATIEPVVSGALKDRGVAVMAVLWSQELRSLGDNLFDDAGILLQELYVNGEEIDLTGAGSDA